MSRFAISFSVCSQAQSLCKEHSQTSARSMRMRFIFHKHKILLAVDILPITEHLIFFDYDNKGITIPPNKFVYSLKKRIFVLIRL